MEWTEEVRAIVVSDSKEMSHPGGWGEEGGSV